MLPFATDRAERTFLSNSTHRLCSPAPSVCLPSSMLSRATCEAHTRWDFRFPSAGVLAFYSLRRLTSRGRQSCCNLATCFLVVINCILSPSINYKVPHKSHYWTRLRILCDNQQLRRGLWEATRLMDNSSFNHAADKKSERSLNTCGCTYN